MKRSLRTFSPLFALLIAACSSSSTGTPAAPVADGGTDAATATDALAPADDAATDSSAPDPLAACAKDPGAPAQTVDANATTDPAGGAAAFKLDKALAGFASGSGKLTALITTENGDITCALDEANAPISVANFVGLARGTRPYQAKDGAWQVGHFYDGLVWHRVIPGFVIQGGDPLGTGIGGPGYDLVDENHVAEPKGTLAMAAGNAPSGSQFYIVIGNGPAANYNVFGTCTTETAVSIAAVPRDGNDKPKTPVHMTKIQIARCP